MSSQLKKCHLCSQRKCACGRIALGHEFCIRCPHPPCQHHRRAPHCAKCWRKIPLLFLCNECNCDYLAGCACPGDQGYIKRCLDCVEANPRVRLPNAKFLPEPIPPMKRAWYEREIGRWVQFYLEVGWSRVELSCFLEPVSYFDAAAVEFYSRNEIQKQAFVKRAISTR